MSVRRPSLRRSTAALVSCPAAVGLIDARRKQESDERGGWGTRFSHGHALEDDPLMSDWSAAFARVTRTEVSFDGGKHEAM